MEKLKNLFFQAVRFGLVGVVNTLVDACAYFLLTLLPFFAQHYLAAQAISYSLGVCNSLVMNKRFTFRETEKMGAKRVALFLLVNAISLGVSSLVLFVCREYGQFPNLIAKGISIVFSLGVNFLLNKLLVFKK